MGNDGYLAQAKTGKDRELAVLHPTNKHFPINPVESITLKDTNNDQQERSNPHIPLGKVDTQ